MYSQHEQKAWMECYTNECLSYQNAIKYYIKCLYKTHIRMTLNAWKVTKTHIDPDQ